MAKIFGGLRPLVPRRGCAPGPRLWGVSPPTPPDRGCCPWPRTPRDLLGRRPSAVPDVELDMIYQQIKFQVSILSGSGLWKISQKPSEGLFSLVFSLPWYLDLSRYMGRI